MPNSKFKRIAVVGSGISGHVAAFRLGEHFEVSLFEADSRFGGHANTVDVEKQSTTSIDTGFIVYNELTYPGLTQLLKELKVPTVESDMSFGCEDELSGLQYSTYSLNSLFAQRSNIFSPTFLGIWRDFYKFRSFALAFHRAHPNDNCTTLGELVRQAKCGPAFWRYFLYPMSGAIWSTAPQEMEHYPARSFLQFMINHRMLEPRGQPIWRTVVGGSRNYVEAMAITKRFQRFKNAAVKKIIRQELGLKLVFESGESKFFDEVVVATHSDQALKLLDQPTSEEQDILAAISYQPNRAVLHSDISKMPSIEGAQASWNVYLGSAPSDRVELTYDMNRLQHLKGGPWLVTLNPQRPIAEHLVHRSFSYHHPYFDLKALQAQDRWQNISGQRGIHYCGAYWRWGFHEDGLWSAMRVVDQILAKENNS